MAKKKEIEFRLPTLDDVLTTQEERDEASFEKIVEIPIDDLIPFHSNELGRQPYGVREDTASFKRVLSSIREVGYLQPIIVREDKEHEGKYEIVGGMRRHRIGQLIGIEAIPAVIRNLNDDEANIIVTDTNEYREDEEILPSEKAWAYKIRLDAMKRQAGRPTKENLVPVGQNYSRKELSEQTGESQTQIQRYIRLTELIPDILEMVDDKRIAMRPAVEISYLPHELQEELLGAMLSEDCTPSHDQTIRMRSMFDKGKLTAESIFAVMSEEKPNQREKIVIHGDRIKKYMPKSLPIERREEYIIKALEHYAKFRQRQKAEKERDER